MGNRRRKDEAHDIGDSMPGTIGDSQGTIHDSQGGPSFDPSEAVVPKENNKQSNRQHEDDSSSESDTVSEKSESVSTRMKYAKKYGDSWPEDRQRRFLREHDITAKEMGWKLTE